MPISPEIFRSPFIGSARLLIAAIAIIFPLQTQSPVRVALYKKPPKARLHRGNLFWSAFLINTGSGLTSSFYVNEPVRPSTGTKTLSKLWAKLCPYPD